MNTIPSDDRINQVETDYYQPYEDDDDEEFGRQRYRALNPLAVASLVFGVFSLLTRFSWWFAAIPVAGIVLGIKALRQITRAPEEMIGDKLALAGLALSVVSWLVGATWLAIAERNAVPSGYKLITYATLEPDPATPDKKVSDEAVELDGTRIFLRGYMYPGRQTMNIKQFIMVPTAGLCKFCTTKIKPTQMVRVEMVGDMRADYKTNLAGIGGKLQIDPNPGLHTSPYVIEADVFQ